ncbi:MAG: nucleotidyltransferase substrate binding protein [Oscillospiraceae bacterium]|nr:nucleotidyltransferase substrate binding protein [Oscillospiraceae bacterium]
MKRFGEKLEDFKKALERLKEGICEEETAIVIDGVIQRFEFTFELAWKTLKEYLEYQGFSEKTGSPREVIQTGFAKGIIKDGESWIKMMLDRNNLAHSYDEEKSREIYVVIKSQYIVLLEELKNGLENTQH